MPLTKKGTKIKGMFLKEYGKKRGTKIFYAWEHRHPFVMKKNKLKKMVNS